MKILNPENRGEINLLIRYIEFLDKVVASQCEGCSYTPEFRDEITKEFDYLIEYGKSLARKNKMANTKTIEQIEAEIAKEEYHKLGLKTTVCVLTLKNGFEVIGTSACVDPSNYNEDIGRKYARERALDKVWELEGYVLQKEVARTLNGE